MDFVDLAKIQAAGFQGFVPISKLQATQCQSVPDSAGVYFIIWPSEAKPVFLPTNMGGHFKGKDPTVALGKLEQKWVRGVKVIYIGKAGDVGAKATLKTRLTSYMEFGAGKPVGHWGGRFIWQLADSENLLACWKVTSGLNAPRLETTLMQDFKAQHGKHPFANLRD